MPETIERSSPLLTKLEKDISKNLGSSLDSKKINDSIGILEIDLLCKCLSHIILKHIEFSQGEVLVDDIVDEDQDIPIFSYGIPEHLNIDMEEIQREIQMKQWESEARNEENYHKLQYLMQGGDPFIFQGQEYPQPQQEVYNMAPAYQHQNNLPEESDRIITDQVFVGDLNQNN